VHDRFIRGRKIGMGEEEKEQFGSAPTHYLRIRRTRFVLWFLFIAAIPLSLVLKAEYRTDHALRFMPFIFLGAALVAGFAERRVRVRHSLPGRSFNFRHR
jgi:hypothetical protein